MAILQRLNPVNANTLRALRHRNFRLFLVGQGISLVGTWLQQLALPWLTYQITRSDLMLGLVGFVGQIPVLLLGPVAGFVSDRTNRHRLVILTQTLAMLQAFALAALSFSGDIQVWQIVALSTVMGTISAFDIPVRQAFLFQMLDTREDLGNAIALNSSLVNLARLIGPAVGGLLIGVAGAGVCFLLNGLSFLAVIASLMMMRIAPQPPQPRHAAGALAHFREGFAYAFGFPPVRDLMFLLTLSSITGTAYVVLMPVFAAEVLGTPDTSAHIFGYLMAASGLGALMGAIHLAGRPSVLGLGRLIAGGALVLGVSMFFFGHTHHLWLAMLLRLTGSAGMVIQMAATNTIIQTVTPDQHRGRVMAFFAMAFIGMAPIGSLLGGALSHRLGPQTTLMIIGSATALGGLIFLARLPKLRNQIRPIYRELGILPPETDPTPG